MNPTIVSFNNGAILQLTFTVFLRGNREERLVQYINTSNNQIINPNSVRLTRDLNQNTTIKYVCCTTASNLPSCDGWATANENCWATADGFTWGI